MNNNHPALTNQISNFNSNSGMLSCILNDIFAKLGSINIQSVSETGRKGVGFGTVEETQRAGRINSHAEAGFFRESGRIIQRLIQFCECGFGISIKKRIRTEQRAGRWRAACPLLVPDGSEYYYENETNVVTRYVDTDSDSWINILDYDSDSDGLSDGEENWDLDSELDKGNLTSYKGGNWTNCKLESDPTLPDCDGDGLLDGAEPMPFVDLDRDGLINVWDWDSNLIGTGGDSDYDDVYVIFRTNATDENTYYDENSGSHNQGDGINDSILDYRKDTWVVIFWYTEIYLYDDGYYNSNQTGRQPVTNSSAYVYNRTSTTVDTNLLNRTQLIWDDMPEEGLRSQNIPTVGDSETYGKYVNLTSADGYPVYTYDSNDDGIYDENDDIAVNVTNLTGTYYHFYKPDTTGFVNDSFTNNHSLPKLPIDYSFPILTDNFVVNHQERYDPRIATNMDIDFDYADNIAEMLAGTNPFDADTDNDGVPDGWELDWNVDSDNDGINDWHTCRLENGSIDINITYKNATNALDPDSDDDGLKDGVEMGITSNVTRSGNDHTASNIGIEYNSSSGRWEDTNIDWVIEGETYWCPLYVSNRFNFTNYDYDDDPAVITDMTNDDTDYDGLKDGQEDVDKDGVWDSDEPNPLDMDSDDDGVADGEDGIQDADEDGKRNCIDYDADDDGIYDGTELGKTMPISDNININNSYTYIINGTDIIKGYFIVDEDPLTTTSHINSDSDNDGLDDGIEDKNYNGAVDFAETNPKDKDTDDDGLADGWIDQMVWNSSSKQFEPCSDGIEEEFNLWEGEDCNNDGIINKDDSDNFTETNPLMFDSDGDSLGDGDEVKPEKINEDEIVNHNNYSSNPLKSDSDNDNLSDYIEIIGWDISVIWEATNEIVKGPYREYSNPNNDDTDYDKLLDQEEFTHSSDPTVFDSDSDNLNDKIEVDLGSNPVGMDGIPPVINDLECWVDPIVKKGTNNIPYLFGINIKITIEVTDSSCVHYIELEIKNKIKREYLQEEQEQTIITGAIINITMNYPYSEKEPLIVRIADFCGNVNESIWKPKLNWLNFKNQHWEDPKIYLETKDKSYSWNRYDYENARKIPSEIKNDIKDTVRKTIQHLINKIRKDYKSFNEDCILLSEVYKKNYIYAANLLSLRQRYAGINLFTLIDIFNTRNYNNIKENIVLLLDAPLPYYPKQYLNNFRNFIRKLNNDIIKLEKWYPKANNDLTFFVQHGLANYIKEQFWWLDEDHDNDQVPNIMEFGFGTHKLPGSSEDVDEDGISDFDECKVIFRASQNCGKNIMVDG